MTATNRYVAIIERIFRSKYKRGSQEIQFDRSELVKAANELKISLPKNLGDVLYSFRYRTSLPRSITKTAKKGKEWIIRPAGRSKYKFALVPKVSISPNPTLSVTKVPDATPRIVVRYGMSDEQSLLAQVRYNRLVDIFTGIACYSLQNHLRTSVPSIGQIEIDELYVGVDMRGRQYVFPVQAKGGNDSLSVVQIEQDISCCQYKFPDLICKPIAAQFLRNGDIALFELECCEGAIRIREEKHYRLVESDDLSREELRAYNFG
ncbi:MAG: hypothetical protein Kow0074_25310 [Candidatus Zixiibacteriota bacterium]